MASSIAEISKIVFSQMNSILPFAKKEISMHPGIPYGNLRYWIKNNFPKATETEIELVFIQLLKCGYSTIFGEIYPPSYVKEDEKNLMKFIHKRNLSEIEYGILDELNKCKRTSIGGLSRIVISKGWHEDELETKIFIQKLCNKNIIIGKNNDLAVNWELIWSDLDENNSY